MINYILERLAVSPLLDARKAPEEFSAFLNVADEIDYEDNDRTVLKIPLKDMLPLPPYELSQAVKWIRAQILQHSVLVFCNVGMSRGPSVTISYLCSIGFGYDEAVGFVSSRVPNIHPAPHLKESVEDCITFYL